MYMYVGETMQIENAKLHVPHVMYCTLFQLSDTVCIYKKKYIFILN